MAVRILDMMENSDDPSIRPNHRSYAACINAVGRDDSHTERAQVAYEIYQRMRKPTTQAINGVLGACSFLPKEKRKNAVSIANKLIDDFKQRRGVSPDHITFSTMFKVIGTSMPPGKEKEEMAWSVFKECCEAGLLSDLVIRNLKKTVPPSVFRELIDSVPEEWRRNV